jgi:hypothetical protein
MRRRDREQSLQHRSDCKPNSDSDSGSVPDSDPDPQPNPISQSNALSDSDSESNSDSVTNTFAYAHADTACGSSANPTRRDCPRVCGVKTERSADGYR